MPPRFNRKIKPCRPHARNPKRQRSPLIRGSLNIELACDNLIAGKVIAYPTEAVWGLGCDPENHSAVARILAIKQRPMEKGLLLVAASIDQLKPLLSSLDKDKRLLLESSWPGPTTWLIPDPDNLFPGWIKGKHKSVAIRVSVHPVVRELCEIFGRPIVSTSANRTGEAEIRSRLILEKQLGHSIDCIVSGDLGSGSKTSEIRDLVTGKTVR